MTRPGQQVRSFITMKRHRGEVTLLVCYCRKGFRKDTGGIDGGPRIIDGRRNHIMIEYQGRTNASENTKDKTTHTQ
jgi:hypothetical protein